jgi:ribosomal protein S5
LTKAFTVPYSVSQKYKACVVKLIPAAGGTWLKAWSSIRSVLELAWYENILSKMMGSNNKLNNALATIGALCAYKHAWHFTKMCVEKIVDKDEVEAKEDNKVKKIEIAWKQVEVEGNDDTNKPVVKPMAKKPIAKAPSKKK